MTAAAVTLPRAGARPAPVGARYRFELVKLLAQWPIRLVLLACWLGPALFVAVISRQSSLPADTVFGRWMGQTGWAGPLVVLSFSCSWVLPLLTSPRRGRRLRHRGPARHVAAPARRRAVTAADLRGQGAREPHRDRAARRPGWPPRASSADWRRSATGRWWAWTAICSRRGRRPVRCCSPGLSALAPTLAFAAVGLLGSVALGRSPMGLVIPALLALLLQVAQLLPLPVVVRVALPSYAFIAWRGLFTDPAQTGPLVVGVAVSLAWAVAATALAYRLFMRRDFTDLAYDGSGRRVLMRAVLPLAVLLAVTVGVIAGATSASGSGIDQAKLDRSLATAFAHLYRMQTEELHRPAVTEAQLRTSASCDKGGSLVADLGPGNDWRCVVTWHLPGATAIGSAIYQLDVTPDGRYVADGDGPQEVNGFFQVHTSTGDAPNPLWQFDGLVDLLTAPSTRS